MKLVIALVLVIACGLIYIAWNAPAWDSPCWDRQEQTR